MQTRKNEDDDCCEVTAGLWNCATHTTEEINKDLEKNTKNIDCCMMTCMTCGVFPIGCCVYWTICCSTPLIGAAVVTPLTGVVDCGIFSTRQVGKCINHCTSEPEKQTMEEDKKLTSHTHR